MNIIFMGTPEFAVDCLEKISSSNNITLVVTQPDRPKGRGRKLTPPAVKLKALSLQLNVIQPESVKDRHFLDVIRSHKPDVIVIVAFGHILSKELINIPKLGCVNLHASLLPKYRGAAPIHRAIINGEKSTGVTSIFINEKMDEGDILLTSDVQIGENDNTGQLFEKLAYKGAHLMVETLSGLEQNTIVLKKQDNDKATYAPKITKEECKINWSISSDCIHNHIRGLTPFPGAYTLLKDKRVIISAVERGRAYSCTNYGELIGLSNKGIIVSCGSDSTILIQRLRVEGKREVTASEFISGHNIKKARIKFI